MSDPKQVAHDKKVQQEKKHNHEEIVTDAAITPQPGKKPPLLHHASDKPHQTVEPVEDGDLLASDTLGSNVKVATEGSR